jgi:glycosyltransferase involved in cell wall biosynthesis
MTQQRVLRVIARMNVGGPAVQVTGLMLELDPRRFEQRLLVGECSTEETDYLALHGLDLGAVRVPGLGRAVRMHGDAKALRSLVGELRTFRPDVVHTHTSKAGVLGRVAVGLARLRPRPAVVHTFHGHLLNGYFGSVGTGALVAVERTLARSTDRLVAVGEGVRDELVAAGIGRPDQYVVVAPGISIVSPPLMADARQVLGIPHDAAVVAYVGRLTRIKRPDRLIATAQRVLREVPNAVFVIAGDGDLLAQTREQARGLGDAVRFLGIRRDVEAVFAAADVAVLTSDNEGMPVSLIEASMVGCPAVTTAVGSAGEVVLNGRTGFVVDREANVLADAVVRLLMQPKLRARMGAAAREHTVKRFSRARLVADTASLYEELLAGGRGQ